MLITRTSMFTRKVHTQDLPVTEEQVRRYEQGELLQNAFPHLSPADREFIKTGVTQEEWEAVFKDE